MISKAPQVQMGARQPAGAFNFAPVPAAPKGMDMAALAPLLMKGLAPNKGGAKGNRGVPPEIGAAFAKVFSPGSAPFRPTPMGDMAGRAAQSHPLFGGAVAGLGAAFDQPLAQSNYSPLLMALQALGGGQ